MKKFTLGIFIVAVLLLTGKTAFAQTISNLSISATSTANLTNDDLESDYSTSGSVVETAEAWYRNGSSETVLYLPFEGGTLNALRDYSGNANNASFSSSGSRQPSWASDQGYNGNGAFIFDGDDYLEAGQILPMNASYTKTAWIYGTGTGLGYRNIMSADYYGENNHFLKINGDGILNAGHTYGSSTVESPDSLFLDQWYFVALTFEYESGEMVLYIDGVEEDRAFVLEAYRSVTHPGVLIGSMNYVSGWEGRIDEPKIYDHALSVEQVETLFAGGNSTVTAAETRGSDVWYVEVTPFSVDDVGTPSVSNSITLLGPELSGLNLEASSTGNLTVDDLSTSYSTNEAVVETAVAWYKDGNPDAIMYLPFEGGPDNALLDFSGNDNHAYYNNSISSTRPEWRSSGGYNDEGYFYFDGYHDHLVAGDILPLNADYTKTAWVYASGFGEGEYRNIISSDFYGPNNHYIKLDISGQLSAGQNTGHLTVLDPVAMPIRTWSFVAVTFDYESGEMILYRDGLEVDRAILDEADRSVADPTVLIGSMAYTVEWAGRIDEPSIYGRVVTPEQIQELYDNGRNTIVSQETRGSEEWHVEVTPFADYEIGTTSTSSSLTVRSVVVSEIPDETISEGSTFGTIDLDGYVMDYEFADNELTWTTHGESDLTVTINPSRVASISIPHIDWYGSEDIYFVASNPFGDKDSSMVTLTVQNVNDAPELTVLGDQSTDEDVTASGLSVDFTDEDPDDSHTINVLSSVSNVSVVDPSSNTSGSTYDLVPDPNWHGSSNITVTVTDDGTGALEDSYTYTLVVNAVNDAPVLTEVGDQATDEDVNLTGLTVFFTDVDVTDQHTIIIDSDDSNVTVESLTGHISGSLYDLVPAEDWNGSAEITVSVTDDGTGTLEDSYSYTLTVNPVNDVPDTIQLSNDEIDEKAVLGTSVGLFSTIDVETEDMHVYTFATDGGVNDVDNSAFIIVGDTLKTNVEIDYEVQDSYSILVQCDDGNGGTITMNFMIIVIDVDETAVEDFYNHPSFKVYPVPANDFVTVEIDNPENNELLLEIYYATGSIVYSEPIFDKKRVDLSGIKDGMYIIRISGEKVYGTRKLIVKDR